MIFFDIDRGTGTDTMRDNISESTTGITRDNSTETILEAMKVIIIEIATTKMLWT